MTELLLLLEGDVQGVSIEGVRILRSTCQQDDIRRKKMSLDRVHERRAQMSEKLSDVNLQLDNAERERKRVIVNKQVCLHTNYTHTRLWSGSCPRPIVPRTRLSTIGDQSFRVTVARAWNSLPTSITALTSLPSFKRQLKTFLFTKSFPPV